MWDESHVIAGRTLAAILTAEKYSDRLLGGNKLISVTNRFTQVALGNNVEVWGDMKRRVVPARLVPDTEHPEARTDFRHPDLEQWVRGSPRRAAGRAADHLAQLDREGPAGGPGGDGEFRAVVPDGRRRAAGGRASAGSGPTPPGGCPTPTMTTAGASTWRSCAPGSATGGSRWPRSPTPSTPMYLKRPPLRRDPDKTMAQQLAYAYRKIREKWHGDLRLVRSDSRDSASGGRTWSVIQRRSQAPEPSSGWSGSSGDDGKPAGQRPSEAATDDAADSQRRSPSSVGRESAGQRSATDHADHPDDANRVSERRNDWPEGSIGAEAYQGRRRKPGEDS